MPSSKLQYASPAWLMPLLGIAPPAAGQEVQIAGQPFLMHGDILRALSVYSPTQSQTSDTFGFKWAKRDTFDSSAVHAHVQQWLSKYGDITSLIGGKPGGSFRPLVLDAGCGAGLCGREMFRDHFQQIRYLGADISTAVEVAATRFKESGITDAGFLQADLANLPLADESVDMIFSEGVLHHTDSTERALRKLVPHLKKGGYFLFYVYRKKGPIREFTDDYIRTKLQGLTQQQAWDALVPLTKLGILLGKLDLEIDVPEPIDLLEIPAGKINLQRLFYWHVFKAFYRPDFSFDEMNHGNFDWFAPANAHRQTLEEIRKWCADCGLEIQQEIVEEAGISIVARRER